MNNESLINRIYNSPVKINKFLCGFSFLFALVVVLNVVPRNETINVIYALFSVIMTLVAVIAFVVYGKRFNEVVNYPNGLLMPFPRNLKMLRFLLLVLFFAWAIGLFTVVIGFIYPPALQSSKQPVSELIYTFLATGPVEETWRWSFILTFVYLSSKYVRCNQRPQLLWIAVGVSSALFGLGHIGKYPAHGFMTWAVYTAVGVFMFVVAYWSRSFWVAVISHSVYDLCATIGMFNFTLWWLGMIVPWGVMGFFYVKWKANQQNRLRLDNLS